MNVIVSNKYEEMLKTLEIEVIKNLNGEYDVDEFIEMFDNFYFQRMILDITAIKDYKNIETLQKISIKLDVDKIILLLDNSPESTSPTYLSKLISMGIYNFTTNRDGLIYLLSHPNEYRDVAHLHVLNPEVNQINNGDQGGNTVVERPGETRVVTNTVVQNQVIYERDRVIGVVNVTDHAGASTLIYMMIKELEKTKNVVGIEVDGYDFAYFNKQNMVSCRKENFGNELLKYANNDVILVELKNPRLETNCGEVLYLIEPSTVKLNKAMKRDRKLFEKLQGKKVILNKSMISSKDLMDFEYETRLKIFDNVPCVNDREDSNEEIIELIQKLGLN